MSHYDTLIIGGGPAGTRCGIRLARAGQNVAVIEKNTIGGACVNRGCISSKTYLHYTGLLETIRKAQEIGISICEPQLSWKQALRLKERNRDLLRGSVHTHLERAGTKIIKGEAQLISDREVKVVSEEGEQQLSADNIVLAIGSKAFLLPGIEVSKRVLTSTEILDLEELPESLGIVGAGATGTEMACIFQSLGVQVFLIEQAPSILSRLDREQAQALEKLLEEKGVKVLTGSSLLACKEKSDHVELHLSDGSGGEVLLKPEKVLMSTGRAPIYHLSELKQLGIDNDGKRVILNDQLQTSLPHVFMIGDSAGRHLTAYGGEAEADLVADHILGQPHHLDYANIPYVVFTFPEIARVGMTEDMVRDEGIDYEVRVCSSSENAKHLITNHGEGFAKVISEKETQRVLGVHILGDHAGEVIHQAVIPVRQQMTIEDWLRSSSWAHPVISEILKLALESNPR